MKKLKYYLIAGALLASLLSFGIVPAMAESPYDAEYDINFASVTISTPGNYLITGSGESTENNIVVSCGADAEVSITLDSVNIDMSSIDINANPDAVTCPFSVEPGANVTLILADGTNNTLRAGAGAPGLQSLCTDDYRWTTDYNNKSHTYVISTLTVTGSGRLNAYGGNASDSYGDGTRGAMSGIGYAGSSIDLSSGNGHYDLKRYIDTVQGPITIEGNVVIDAIGGNGSYNLTSGDASGIGQSKKVSVSLPAYPTMIKIGGSAMVAATGGEDLSINGSGIYGNVHITDNARVIANGGGTDSNSYYGGSGISPGRGTVLIDGNANVTATGNSGGAGIGCNEDGKIEICGDSVVKGYSDQGSGIGGVGGDYSTGGSNPTILISGNANVSATGGGNCSTHYNGFLVYDIGAGCDTTASVKISGSAVVTAGTIGGSYDSYITVGDNATVNGIIESKFNFDNWENADCGGSATITENAQIKGSVSAMDVIISDTASVQGNVYCGSTYDDSYGAQTPAGTAELRGSASVTGSVTAGTLKLKDSASVNGLAFIHSISLDDNATVNGSIKGDGEYVYDPELEDDILSPLGIVVMNGSSMVLGSIQDCTSVTLNDTSKVVTKEQVAVALPATATPRTTPLMAFDCGPCAVARDILLDNGTDSFTISVPAGYRSFLCAAPAGDYSVSRDGYSYSEDGGNDRFPIALTNGAISTVFVSCLQKSLTFNVGEASSLPSQTTDIGTVFVAPPVPKYTGYAFAGWYADSDKTIPFDFSAAAVEDLTAYAKWTPRTDTRYKVEHAVQDAYGPGYTTVETETLTGTTDSAATATAKAYTGFLLSGQLPSATIAANGSTVLTVKYDRVLHNVSFVIDGSSEALSQQVRNATYPLLEDPERAGYIFEGWYSDDVYHDLFGYSFGKATRDTWRADDGVTTHIISTASDWGSFTSYVNNGGETEHHLFLLDRNIDFKGANIPTIEAPFKGNFNGHSFTLSNFKTAAPLFATIEENAQVRLFGVDRCTLKATDGSDTLFSVGIIAGINRGCVSDVAVERSTAIVERTRSGDYDTCVGGLVGANYGELRSSYFYYRASAGSIQIFSVFPRGTVPTKLQHGGLAGYNNGTIAHCYVSASMACEIGDISSGNYIYFAALVGLNDVDGTIQDTYWSYPYFLDIDRVLLISYRNKTSDGIVSVPGRTLFLGNDHTQCPLTNNSNYVVTGGHLTLSSAQNTGILAGGTTLYAKWSPAPDTGYTVNHYCQDVSGSGYSLVLSEPKSGTTGATVNAEAADYTGFTEATTHPSRIPGGTITGDGSLALAFYYDRTTHSVSFDSTGGTAVAPLLDIRYGAVATAPIAPSKQGYDFSGWCSDTSLTTDFSFSIPVTDDVTLYAKWSPKGDTPYTVEHYTQNLDDDGYTKADTQNLSGTTAAVVSASPKTYTGFRENGTHPNRITTGEVASDGSLLLKLYYDRNLYDVSFDATEGSAVATQSVRFMGLAKKPADPIRSGYLFKGWFVGEAAAEYDFNTPVDAPLILAAKWAQAPSSSSGGGGTSTYKITVKFNSGGAVTPGTISVNRNGTQVFTVTPDTGFTIGKLLIDGKEVPVASSYKFEKVTTDHTLEVVFEKSSHTCPSEPFVDIDTSQWYHASIDTALTTGLMRGISDTGFAPYGNLTRGEFAMILARVSGTELRTDTSSQFADVSPRAWYAPAIEWAAKETILLGDGTGRALPTNTITREQFITMLYRYCGVHAADTGILSNFSDGENISPWAADAVAWAVKNKLVEGTSATALSPLSEITRAECAAIMSRYLEYVK